MTNRKHHPNDLKNKKLLKNRGDSEFRCRGHLTALAWMDRKTIHFLSNFHDPNDMTTATRRNKDGTQVEVPMPKLVKDYNKYMGGCDLNDQMTRLYKSRRHYRWPRRLFIKFIMWAFFNSYVLYQEKTKPKKPSFRKYVDSLCLSLVGDYRSAHVKKARHLNVEQRLQNVRLHHPEFPADTSTGHNCVVCNQKHERFKRNHPGVAYKDIPTPRSKSCIRCSLCQAYLCIKRGSTCWTDYHTKVEY